MNEHNLARFLSKVDTHAPSGCWRWTARTNRHGYGLFVIGHSKAHLAHRVSYEHWKGPFPKEKKVLHSCDNPACVNPEHLSVGTQGDNVRDMVQKGRNMSIPKPGESNPQSKLTAAQVAEIRTKYKPRKITLKVLAEEYGVCEANISMIV